MFSLLSRHSQPLLLRLLHSPDNFVVCYSVRLFLMGDEGDNGDEGGDVFWMMGIKLMVLMVNVRAEDGVGDDDVIW